MPIYTNNSDIQNNWLFVYGSYSDPNFSSLLKEHKLGFYYDLINNNAYSFEKGISHLVGKEIEDKVYNRWWIDNS